MESVEQRLASLLPTLSLEEKVWQLVAPGFADEASYRALLDQGHGLSNVRFRMLTHNFTAARAERDRLQAYALKQSTKRIPLSFVSEGLISGAYGGTNFPTPQALSLTWNTSLAEEVHAAIALQARAQGADAVFGPVINVFPDPRFGRLCEGWGAEPWLTARFAMAATRGLQGPVGDQVGGYVPAGKVVAIAKHFLGYGDTRGGGGLNAAPIDVSPRTLRERYVPPWRAFFAAGGRGVMAAHQPINSVPTHANGDMLTGLLRRELKAQAALVVSDASDVKTLVEWRVASNTSHAAALAVVAGVDVEITHGPYPPYVLAFPMLIGEVKAGRVPMSAIDRAAANVLRQKLAAHLFDSPSPSPPSPSPPPPRAAALQSRALARRAAAQGIVLLHNRNGTLPLPHAARAPRLVLIGPNAGCSPSDPPPSEPGVACPAGLNQLGTHYMHVGSEVTTLHAAAIAAQDAGRVQMLGYAPVCNASGTMGCTSADLASAVDVARAHGHHADAIVVVVGDSLVTCEESKDRDSLELPGDQAALIDAVADAADALAAPLVLVLVHGRPVTFGGRDGTRLLQRAAAVISCFRCGEEGGHAMLDALLGSTNPSGRLTQAWPRAVGQVGGPYSIQAIVQGKSLSYGFGEFVQYADGPSSSPLFPFGYGLSYSHRVLRGPLRVDAPHAHDTPPAASQLSPRGEQAIAFSVTASLCTLAGSAGDDVIQLYVTDPDGLPLVRPYRRLVGYQRLRAPAANGHSQCAEVHIAVTRDDLAFYNADLSRTVHPGAYQLILGMHELDDQALLGNVTVA